MEIKVYRRVYKCDRAFPKVEESPFVVGSPEAQQQQQATRYHVESDASNVDITYGSSGMSSDHEHRLDQDDQSKDSVTHSAAYSSDPKPGNRSATRIQLGRQLTCADALRVCLPRDWQAALLP